MSKALQKKKEETPVKKLNLNLKNYPIIAIGTKHYLEERPGVLHGTTMAIMKDRHGRDMRREVEHCLGFTLEPSHTKHRRIIEDKYNVYKRLTHKPVKGEWKTIESLLKHVFSDSYQMGLEYFWNLYMNPKQKLPFMGIVSEKKGTGKSTFLDFVRLMFEENVSVVSEHDFTTNFNSGFVNSLVCISDEHAEGKSRHKIGQKLKMYTTASNIRVEQKGRDSFTSPVYFKMIFAGNDEDTLTFIEEENTRYWILRLEPLKEVNINLEKQLKQEIPCFIHYLKNEFEARESRGRLYFDPSEFQNEASRLIQENSISSMGRNIKDLVEGIFEATNNLQEIYLTPKDIVEALKLRPIEKSYVSRVLKKELKMQPTEVSKRYTPGHMLEFNSLEKRVGRIFCFINENFIDKNLINAQLDILDENFIGGKLDI